jgi:putative glutamine amidotransferase
MPSEPPRPLIAVSAAIETLPTPFGTADFTKVAIAYTNALYAVGARPVVMPVVPDPPADLLAGFAGLVLTGGGDLDPALYGEDPDPSVRGVRRDRDTFETALYLDAVARGLPILAICRGMQLVNVLRGGTLTQHITGDSRHWQKRPPGEPGHAVVVSQGSALAQSVGAATEVHVNSLHHQCVRDLGDRLRITAMCLDVIEAMEATDGDIVGVQWHPEQMALTDTVQLSLFDRFVRRAVAAS